MRQLEGLIFDLDGTLVDSAPDLRQALNMTLRAHGRRDLTLDEVKPMLGDGMLPMLGRAFALTGDGISDSESYGYFQQFISHYRSLPPAPEQLYPLAKETLHSMKARNITLGLCTNKQEASTLRLLQGLGIHEYFDFIAGGDTFQFHKPHPDHVHGVIAHMTAAKEGCVMIGDSQNDVAAAKGAGIPCLVVTHGYGLDVLELDADGFINSFAELPAALGKLGFALE